MPLQFALTMNNYASKFPIERERMHTSTLQVMEEDSRNTDCRNGRKQKCRKEPSLLYSCVFNWAVWYSHELSNSTQPTNWLRRHQIVVQDLNFKEDVVWKIWKIFCWRTLWLDFKKPEKNGQPYVSSRAIKDENQHSKPLSTMIYHSQSRDAKSSLYRKWLCTKDEKLCFEGVKKSKWNSDLSERDNQLSNRPTFGKR